MKHIHSLAICVLLTLFACNKSDDVTQEIQKANTTNYKTFLYGYKAYPPNSSPATGIFTASLNQLTRELSYSLQYSDMTETPTSWHIHKGPEGEIGPVIFSFGPVVPSPLTGTVKLTDTQVKELMNNEYYVDIHSNAFDDSEIRGQIGKSTGK